MKGTSYCFVHDSNWSLIAAFQDAFQHAGPSFVGGEYRVSRSQLSDRSEEADRLGLRFDGHSLLGANSTAIATVGDALREMKPGGTGSQTYVAFAAVSGEMYEKMNLLYDTMLKDATSQGMLPFPMLVTTNRDAAQFLLDSCEAVSGSVSGRKLAAIA